MDPSSSITRHNIHSHDPSLAVLNKPDTSSVVSSGKHEELDIHLSPQSKGSQWWDLDHHPEFYEEALREFPDEHTIDAIEAKRLVKKIDRHIIPCLAVCYAFYYVDKTTLSYAAIFGIKDSLHLHGTQYSWLSSVFYFGWLVWAIPSNLLMQKSPPGKYLAVNIFMWGALLMTQAASRNYVDLVVLRILSGAFEAIADPAFMLITTMWYTRSEQPSRISAWYAANGIGVAGGGLLGYGIGHIKGSLPSWRYEFLIVGAICCSWAIVLFFVLPDSPAAIRAPGFSRREKLLAVARVRGNQTGIENRTFKWSQARECVLDLKTWLFFLLGFVANIPNGGISNFSTLIIKGLGFDTLQTTLLGIPQGALVCIWIGLGAVLNDRLPKNSRTYVCMLFMLPTIGGTLGFLLAPQHASAGRLFCYYLTGSYQCSFVLGLSLITSNTAGQTKKQITSAMIWLGACVGNIAGPFFYRSQDAPEYRLGIGSMLVCNCVEVLIFVALRVFLIRENRRKDLAQAARKLDSTNNEFEASELNVTAFSDITDRENLSFRYVY